MITLIFIFLNFACVVASFLLLLKELWNPPERLSKDQLATKTGNWAFALAMIGFLLLVIISFLNL